MIGDIGGQPVGPPFSHRVKLPLAGVRSGRLAQSPTIGVMQEGLL